MINTYLDYRLIARDMGKAIDRVERQPQVERETAYYLDNIGKVKTVEEFVNNDRLFRYAMKAHGLSDMAYAKAFMVKVLKEGVSDPDSFANKLTDKRYAEFAATYNFEKLGEQATIYNRAQHEVPKNFGLQVDLAMGQEGFRFYQAETANYVANIGSIKSIDDLLGDQRLLTYAMATFGLSATTETPARIREMLEGGVADPQSPANRLADKSWAAFVGAFNFAEHGAGTTARDAVQKTVPQQYVALTEMVLIRPHADHVKAEAAYYAANIGKVTSIDGLMRDTRLLTYAMAAYGLDAATEKPATIREMLEGGVTDADSPANLLADKRYAAFVGAFDFVEHGTQTTTRDAVTKETPRLHGALSELGLVRPGADYVKAETAYYLANVGKLESIDDMMADRRLLNFALSSYGLDPAVETPQRIRQMLEGGVSDPASPANKLTDKRYAGFVAAFNFAEYGEKATTITPAQLPAIDKFMRQTLEEDAGNRNEGVRLALYFERKASGITNFYQVLADPALAQVVRTALSLPDSFASADIDRQVKFFEEKLDIKDFSDPQALEKFLTRFTSLWEIANPTSPAQAATSILFSQPVEYGISTNLLFSIQSMRR
ncbi:DUF1217 domain-containing protein [Kumtagia ephedrae]|uniref:DUF1217 domain-containing protein n=1 Tax=Kumtagia ephedrae TaxID=2116701 RepID=A0A2P7SLE3_9HYPH|nr:DUF1217 domain-containing protein [Mesorhizobium ephedrae]PSJ63324.1 hypothetical protein C7I84_06715 [Mesorhizobium ephedrae]